jgi:hypothetical protein
MVHDYNPSDTWEVKAGRPQVRGKVKQLDVRPWVQSMVEEEKKKE